MLTTLLMHLLNVYEVLIIIRVALSWIGIEKGNPFSEFVFAVTEPVLKMFRFVVPVSSTMRIDISCIIALFAINILKRLIFSLTFGI